MRRPTFYRNLRPSEHMLVWTVFRDTLPSSRVIGIGDGLGFGDRPWTDWGSGYDSLLPDMQFQINLGDYASVDLSLKTWTPYDGNVSDLLIHEMTHVWQYWHGFGVKASSIWANTLGAGYDFTAGDPWDDYNAEQQASIVEKWHKRGQTKSDELYPYITEVIWSHGDPTRRKMSLAELKNTLYTPPPPPPNPTVIHVADVDGTLVPILEKRYAATDVAGFGGRVKRLEEIFRGLDQLQAQQLNERLTYRRNTDKVSKYFYEHLSSATRVNLLKILQERARPIIA